MSLEALKIRSKLKIEINLYSCSNQKSAVYCFIFATDWQYFSISLYKCIIIILLFYVTLSGIFNYIYQTILVLNENSLQ